jgi:hypothetical protein
MWFRFPKGTQGITVEKHYYTVEARNEEGFEFFRAPAHYAPTILAINGFELGTPPDGAPADLPLPDPARDNALIETTRTNEALKIEITAVREDLNAALAKVTALANEKAELTAKVAKLEDQVAELTEQIEDQPEAAVVGKRK